MRKLALKLRVFQWVAEYGQPFDIEDVMDALKSEYGTERQFTKKRIDTYLQSLLGACMIDASEVSLDANEDLVVKYILTDFGKKRIKYIPI